MERDVEVVRNLQTMSANVFDNTVANLRVGMTELDIADRILAEYRRQGVREYWYNVPIIVFIGVDRFIDGNMTDDYTVKSPSDVKLGDGDAVFIDLSPMDTETKLWGDYSRTFVFNPRNGVDEEQLAFIETMDRLQHDAMLGMTVETTGGEVADFILRKFGKAGITLLDKRNNVGHSMHSGVKSESNRVFLDEENGSPLGEGIFAVEPGGSCLNSRGETIVARRENCVYLSKNSGPKILI